MLSLRLDTTGGRYIEGLDPASSYAVLERFSPESIRGYRAKRAALSRRHRRVGGGDLPLRAELDRAGFDKVKIVASSGFGPAKCRSWPRPSRRSTSSAQARSCPRTGRRPTPPPTSSNMTRETGQDRPRVSCTAAAQRQRPAALNFSVILSEAEDLITACHGMRSFASLRMDRMEENAMLKLYFAPGVCSTASHIGLEESGAKYDSQAISFARRAEVAGVSENQSRGRVPALVVDEGTIVENTAILDYVAAKYAPQLMPKDPLQRAKAISLMAWFSKHRASQLHPYRPARALRHRYVGARAPQGDRP